MPARQQPGPARTRSPRRPRTASVPWAAAGARRPGGAEGGSRHPWRGRSGRARQASRKRGASPGNPVVVSRVLTAPSLSSSRSQTPNFDNPHAQGNSRSTRVARLSAPTGLDPHTGGRGRGSAQLHQFTAAADLGRLGSCRQRAGPRETAAGMTMLSHRGHVWLCIVRHSCTSRETHYLRQFRGCLGVGLMRVAGGLRRVVGVGLAGRHRGVAGAWRPRGTRTVPRLGGR